MPDLSLSSRDVIAIAVAVVAYVLLGAIWYARPVFGRIWARGLGLPDDFKPTPGRAARSLLVMVAGSILMMYIFKLAFLTATPSVWLQDTNSPAATTELGLRDGFIVAGILWLGFLVPPLLNARAFEDKSWTVLAVNGGFSLASLLMAAAIFVYVHG